MQFEYSPAWPHGDLTQVLPDIFVVTGTNRTRHAGIDFQTSRNMVVLRTGQTLTLINSVRLDEAGLQQLTALGTVAHVIRLGAFHGRDDPFYRDTFAAALWALPASQHADDHPPDHLLAPHGPLPIADAELFVFASSKHPEAALLLPRHGLLITCDAIQNWTAVDRYFSPECGAMFTAQGLIRPANIPATWLGACAPDAADFHRLLDLDFRHLISAHGEPLLHAAHARIAARVAELFPT